MSDELEIDVVQPEVEIIDDDQIEPTVADDEQDAQAESEDGLQEDGDKPEDEAIDLTGIETAIITHTDQSEDDKRGHNRFAAKMRVQLKEKERKLEELRKANAAGIDANDPKPDRLRYIQPDVVAKNFGGDREYARDVYEQDLAAWELRSKQRHADAVTAIESQVRQEQELLQVQDDFEKKAATVKAKIKDFDANVDRAEKYLTVRASDGSEYDGTLIVKQYYAEDAPAMLAAIGANKKLADKLMSAATPAEVHVILADLKVKIKSALSSRKEVSKAPALQSVRGDVPLTRDQLLKAMDKASDKGDYGLFRQLKKQLQGLKS